MTLEECDAASLPLYERDYCALERVKFKSCIRYNFPFWPRCQMYRSELQECQYKE